MGSKMVSQSRFARELVSAAGKKENLVVLGLSVLAKLALGAWWIFLLGVCAYVMLTLKMVLRPGAPRRRLGAGLESSRMPEPFQLQEPVIRTLVGAYSAGRNKVDCVLSQTSDEVKAYLRQALLPLDELEGCAARLATRAEVLAQYLRINTQETVHAEICSLDELVRITSDSVARQEYEHALSCRHQQLDALEEIARAQERATASLQRVVAVVEGLSTQLVNLCLLDAHVKEDLSSDLSELLERIQGEMQTSEQTLRGLTLLPE